MRAGMGHGPCFVVAPLLRLREVTFRHRHFALAFGLMFVFVAGATAQAGPVTCTSHGDFIAAAGPLVVEDFEGGKTGIG